jgi:tight adherence protein B
MRRALLTLLAGLVVSLAAAAAAGAAGEVSLTPVARLPFPERGYLVDLPGEVGLRARDVRVTENGQPVRRLTITPLRMSDVRAGVVLAIDASESMTGAPFAGALDAARAFVQNGRGQEIGLVAFNGEVAVLERPTEDTDVLARALDTPPALGYGTRIYDALDRSIAVLRQSKVASGAVVVLSDGADLGSETSLDAVVATAARHHIRVFTVGLRSGAFEPAPLEAIAERTGGAYAEAATAGELESIYAAISRRLAREYLVQYRSDAAPESQVDVRIELDGVGSARVAYVAPTPAGVAPYHRSLLTRFLLSPGSILLLAVLLAALVAWVVVRMVGRDKTMVVERITEFSDAAPVSLTRVDTPGIRRGARYTTGRWAELERVLEIARIELSPRAVVAWTLVATLLIVLVLFTLSPIVSVLGLLTPVGARALVRHKLRRVRNEFADQLPANLQVLASALRAGHSFSGALGVVVENAHEPARSELQRIVRDDQFGVPPEEAVRRIADRMDNRDLEQVALLAELQRTAGGNAAEVLDTVVATIRERSELRRLVRTLTAQGRMARWILTGLPIFLASFLWLMHPDLMGILFESTGGQIALVVAALLVAAGSALIQRIVDIDV